MKESELIKEIMKIENKDNGNKVHFIIYVYCGNSTNKMDVISSYTTDDYRIALDEFEEWLKSERDTLRIYNCKYVAVALEVWEVDEYNYLIKHLDTIRYEVLENEYYYFNI